MHWHPKLTAEAERDLAGILQWTMERFGAEQARVYRETIRHAVGELRNGPQPPGVKDRDEILPGLKTLHIARGGRRGRHFILFRIDPRHERTIEIMRLLHDSMDFVRHLPEPKESAT